MAQVLYHMSWFDHNAEHDEYNYIDTQLIRGKRRTRQVHIYKHIEPINELFEAYRQAKSKDTKAQKQLPNHLQTSI